MNDPSVASSGPQRQRNEASAAPSSQRSTPAAARLAEIRGPSMQQSVPDELPDVSIASGRPLDGRLGPAQGGANLGQLLPSCCARAACVAPASANVTAVGLRLLIVTC